jgi:hypothetical protein
MSEHRALDARAEGTRAGNLLTPADPLATRARHGSLASIFEQATNQQLEKDETKQNLTEKDALPISANGQAGKVSSSLRGNTSTEKVRPTAAKVTPPKRSRRRRKTLHDAETPQKSTRFAECLEVTQSRWVQDPEDPSREIVTLTGEVTSLDSETLDSSFRWIHYHREQNSISFEDFEKVVDKDQGLYEDEAAVASKCVREAKLLRRTFGRGKYFEPTVHEVSDVMGTEVEKVPIKATFISVPILALMKGSNESLPYLNRHALRTPARHPIRSLLQYSNILALDTERDKRQVTVVTKLGEDEHADTKPFIHVPELWALVINMYTVITCAPLSSQILLGENIQLVQPPTNRQRFVVKFTSLRGTLHDLRCQTWFGLLEAISRIEWNLKDIDVHLNDSTTEFKLIDRKFRPIDQDRWIKLAEAKGVRRIGVRLVRIPEGTKLTLEFAARKLRACVNATWVLLGIPYQEDILEAKLRKALANSAPQREIDHLKLRLDGLAVTERKFKRSRYFNRMLLYAARAHILNPKQSLTTSRKAKTRRAFGRVVMASKMGPAVQPEVSSPSSNRRESTSYTRPVFYENRLKVPDIAIRRASIDSAVSKVSPLDQRITSDLPSAPRADGQPQKVSYSWYEPGNNAVGSTWMNQYANAYNTPQRTSRPSSPANDKTSLWAPPADRSTMDRVPLSAEGRVIPAIVDPYSSGLSALTGRNYRSVEVPSTDASQNLLRSRSATGRRHSSFGVAGEVLAVSPLRLPLRVEDYSASSKKPAASLTPPESHTPQPEQIYISDKMNRTRFRTNVSIDEDYSPLTIAEKAEKRAKENVGGRTPFFQWRTGENGTTPVRTKAAGGSISGKAERIDRVNTDSRRGTEVASPYSHAAHDILTDIDSFIMQGKYHDVQNFNVSPSDYDGVLSRKRSEVTTLLQPEAQESARPSFDDGPEEDEPIAAQRHLVEAKMQLLLSVHGLLECFVNQEEVEAKVLGKIWGVMYNLCELQLRQVSTCNSIIFCILL